LDEIRESAIRAIERLATEFTNRSTMAHHDGLLVAIAQATEREAKLEAKLAKSGGGSLSGTGLVGKVGTDVGSPTPQQNHAFLAKPLLMSLLVAM
jgi:hypothetical protein